MASQPSPAESLNERRRYVRATLVGSALVSPQSGAKGFTAVLHNVNKVGAGLHAKETLPVGERITVSLAFLDPDRVEQQENSTPRSRGSNPGRRGC